MNLVDSCGWLEYFADGPNAGFFARAIEDQEHLVVPSICVLEVFKKVLARNEERNALLIVAAMKRGRVVDLDFHAALSAAKIGAELKLPLADSVILAAARTHQAVIWTQDADFKGLPGVKYIEKRSEQRGR